MLVGNSLRGYICLCVAAQYPEVVSSLILVNSAGYFSSYQKVSQTNSIKEYNRPVSKLFNYALNILHWTLCQRVSQFILFQYIQQPWVISSTPKKVYLDQGVITTQLVEGIHHPSEDKGVFDVFCSVFNAPQGERNDVLLK